MSETVCCTRCGVKRVRRGHARRMRCFPRETQHDTPQYGIEYISHVIYMIPMLKVALTGKKPYLIYDKADNRAVGVGVGACWATARPTPRQSPRQCAMPCGCVAHIGNGSRNTICSDGVLPRCLKRLGAASTPSARKHVYRHRHAHYALSTVEYILHSQTPQSLGRAAACRSTIAAIRRSDKADGTRHPVCCPASQANPDPPDSAHTALQVYMAARICAFLAS